MINEQFNESTRETPVVRTGRNLKTHDEFMMDLLYEYNSLNSRISRLEEIIDEDPASITQENKNLWKLQLEVMKAYADALKKRIILNL